jgi:hypothetical protein
VSQELGRLDRPSALQFVGKKKLLLLPLIQAPNADEVEVKEILDRFWLQAEQQIDSLSAALGPIQYVFHETVTEDGEPGLKQLEMFSSASYEMVKNKIESGSSMISVEDPELLMENLDLRRLLMMPLSSHNVAVRIQDWFSDNSKSRNEGIANKIKDSIQSNEVGILLISDGHQVQFPADLEVFYVAPPALDEFRQWLQSWVQKQRAEYSSQVQTDSAL